MACVYPSGSEADLRRQKWLVLLRGCAVGDASSCGACSHLSRTAAAAVSCFSGLEAVLEKHW